MKLNVPLLVLKIIETLQKASFEAYVVGGAIRDLLMEKPTDDWDFTTSAKPEEIRKLFPESFYDNRFGTVGITAEEAAKQFGLLEKFNFEKANLKLGSVFDITTFRKETTYSDRRHPDKVTWGKTLKDDLKRRDFTINALALKPPATSHQPPARRERLETGDWRLETEIVDLFNGQQDLKNSLIRAVGDPNKRFAEDALRMMRGIRFASQLGFTIEEKTLAAIVKNSRLISFISFERIRDELFKILTSSYPKDGIKLMFASGILEHVLPELIPMRGVEQAGHHTKDVWNHSLDALQNCPSPDPVVRLATLLHDVGKPAVARKKGGKITFYNHEIVGGRTVKRIANRLKLSKKQKDKLWLLVRYHMFAYDPKMTDAAIRRFIRRVGVENINDMMMLRIGDRIGGGSRATSWRLRELQQRIGEVLYTPMKITDLKVNGNDVMKILGLKSGPKIGKILNKLFEEVLEDAEKNNREYLLKRINELA